MNIPFLSKKTNCCHQTKEGKQCNATPQAGKAYCFFHDPELAQERAAARRQGGLTSIGKAAPVVPPNLPLVSLKTLDDVSQFFEQITNYVLQGQMDLRTAAILCSLANGKLRTLRAIERSQREAAKATQAGKESRHSSNRNQSYPVAELRLTDMLTGETGIIRNGASGSTDSAASHELETGNSKPETRNPKLFPRPYPARVCLPRSPSRLRLPAPHPATNLKLETRNLKLFSRPYPARRCFPYWGTTVPGRTRFPPYLYITNSAEVPCKPALFHLRRRSMNAKTFASGRTTLSTWPGKNWQAQNTTKGNLKL